MILQYEHKKKQSNLEINVPDIREMLRHQPEDDQRNERKDNNKVIVIDSLCIIENNFSNDILCHQRRIYGGTWGACTSFFLAIICIFRNHFEEPQTVLFEVELIINNAPSIYVYPITIETC